jgi:hypothetical protein
MTSFSRATGAKRPRRFGRLLPAKTLAGYWVAIAAVVAVALFSYGALRGNEGTADRVAQSLEAIEQLQSVPSTIKDAETGQRGFLLGGDESYLRPYTIAESTLRRYAPKRWRSSGLRSPCIARTTRRGQWQYSAPIVARN